MGKNGVVRDPAVHEDVIRKVLRVAEAQHFTPAGLTYSPVKGPKGNIEYLLYLRMQEDGKQRVEAASVHEIVAEAHRALDQ